MIYKITLEQALRLIPQCDDSVRVLKLSSELFVGYYDNTLICVMGLIPPTLLADEVYLWLVTTEFVKDHKVAFGRAAKRFIETILSLYPSIVGHCEQRSFNWLTRLGAVIGPPNNGLFPFRITR